LFLSHQHVSLSLSILQENALVSTEVAHRRRLLAEAPTGIQVTTPSTVSLDESFTVAITVQGAGGETSRSLPIDVVFAIDSSGSMQDNDPTNLRLEACKQFVDQLDITIDAGAVVSWNNEIDLVFPSVGLTNDFLGLKGNIDLAQTDIFGGTDLDLGLHRAIVSLESNTRLPPFDAVIIFLTDGDGTYTPSTQPGSWTAEAARNGYTIYSIGLGNSVITANLEDMAIATGGKYYPSPSAANIQSIFEEIFQQVVLSSVPYNINLVTQSMSYIDIDQAGITPPPDAITVDDLDGTTRLTWLQVDSGNGLPFGQSRVFTYSASSSLAGLNLQVDMGTASSYTDVNGGNAATATFFPAFINVVEPTKGKGKGFINKGKGYVPVKGHYKKTKGRHPEAKTKGKKGHSKKQKGKGYHYQTPTGVIVVPPTMPIAPTVLPPVPLIGLIPVSPPVLPPTIPIIISTGKGQNWGHTTSKIHYVKNGGKGKDKKQKKHKASEKKKMKKEKYIIVGKGKGLVPTAPVPAPTPMSMPVPVPVPTPMNVPTPRPTPKPCGGQLALCTIDDDCCSGLFCDGVECKAEPLCAPVGRLCNSNNDNCCAGLTCLQGQCRPGNGCGNERDPCLIDAECCSDLVCNQGQCSEAAMSPTCKALLETCFSDRDCCPGLTCNGVFLACEAPPPIEPPRPCKALLETCFSDGDCCPGLTCNGVFLACEAPPPIEPPRPCKIVLQTCFSDGDCCPGLTCNGVFAACE
jgi:hypothetical protein